MRTVCRACHFGRIQATLVPFMASFAGKMLLVPGAPAYSCDYCGATKHDASFLQDLQLLLREQSATPLQAADNRFHSPPQQSVNMPTIEEYPLG